MAAERRRRRRTEERFLADDLRVEEPPILGNEFLLVSLPGTVASLTGSCFKCEKVFIISVFGIFLSIIGLIIIGLLFTPGGGVFLSIK